VPIFGFVYFREQAVQKREVETALRAYRDQLEDLVDVRTAELQQANKQLERAAVLEERQRIAAEMHDGLAQTLSTMSLKSGQALDMLQAGEIDEVIRQFDEMQEVIARAVSDVRRSIASLRQTPRPVQSLQEALDEMIADTCFCASGTDLVCHWFDDPLFLENNNQEQVLRVVQEALFNACRHAQADKIVFTLEPITGGLSVSIADDGIGFDIEEEEAREGGHFGLGIMRARSARLKGHLIVDSQPGQGTIIKLNWPAEFDLPKEDEQTTQTEVTVSS
jgi:signal transduction histidine kinase